MAPAHHDQGERATIQGRLDLGVLPLPHRVGVEMDPAVGRCHLRRNGGANRR
jgi:hypothetical protein